MQEELSARQSQASLQTHIEPARGWPSLGLAELVKYRELLFFLIWRDIKVRYKQTVLGAAWAIIQPFMTMVVFSLFFGRLAGIPSEGVPYPIFSYAALVPWTFFANGLSQSANSLVGSSNLITKVYFPRLVIPAAAVLSGFVDFVLAFLVLLGMMLFYGIVPTWNLAWLPLFLLLALVTALGVGLWLSALNVQYRDVRCVAPFLVQFRHSLPRPSPIQAAFSRSAGGRSAGCGAGADCQTGNRSSTSPSAAGRCIFREALSAEEWPSAELLSLSRKGRRDEGNSRTRVRCEAHS